MTRNDVTQRSAMVVGASRGLGCGIAAALAEAGVPVIAVSRTERALADLAATRSIHSEVADATDPTVAGSLLDRHEPQALVLVAGAAPLIRPLQHQTWETFSANWQTDVRMAFHWLREALLKPLRPGSRVVVMSSGAALQGSPLSGGYAGAKATQRFIAAYAQEEANRDELGITFTSILPRITPLTDLGRPAVTAYAARRGQTEEEYMQQMGPPVTPEAAGSAVLELIQADAKSLAPAYLLTGAGLQQLRPPPPPMGAGGRGPPHGAVQPRRRQGSESARSAIKAGAGAAQAPAPGCVTAGSPRSCHSWGYWLVLSDVGVFRTKELMMRVFVAGATGAIGRQLVPRLVAAGHEVYGMTRSESKRAMLSELGAVPVVADALDPGQVAEAVAHAVPDVIVHQLTAIGAVDMRHFDRSFALTNRLRTEGTDHLLSAGQAVGVRRFVAQGVAGYGTYERTGGSVKSEEDPLDPTPAREFRESMAAVRHLEEAVLGAEWTEGIVLRYGAFYGPGTSMARGGAQFELVRRRKFPLVGDGAGVWSFIHIEDAAEATAAAIEHGSRGVYNVVDDDPAPVAEWLPALAQMLGAKKPMRVPRFVGRLFAGETGVVQMTEIRGASNAKAKRELQWRPAHPSWRHGFAAA